MCYFLELEEISRLLQTNKKLSILINNNKVLKLIYSFKFSPPLEDISKDHVQKRYSHIKNFRKGSYKQRSTTLPDYCCHLRLFNNKLIYHSISEADNFLVVIDKDSFKKKTLGVNYPQIICKYSTNYLLTINEFQSNPKIDIFDKDFNMISTIKYDQEYIHTQSHKLVQEHDNSIYLACDDKLQMYDIKSGQFTNLIPAEKTIISFTKHNNYIYTTDRYDCTVNQYDARYFKLVKKTLINENHAYGNLVCLNNNLLASNNNSVQVYDDNISLLKTFNTNNNNFSGIDYSHRAHSNELFVSVDKNIPCDYINMVYINGDKSEQFTALWSGGSIDGICCTDTQIITAQNHPDKKNSVQLTLLDF